MESKCNIDIGNIKRMNEIADIYKLTNQNKKSIKYHENILKFCNQIKQTENVLSYKIISLNQLEKKYKSLETTEKLLKLNPHNIDGLLNLAKYLMDDKYV